MNSSLKTLVAITACCGAVACGGGHKESDTPDALDNDGPVEEAGEAMDKAADDADDAADGASEDVEDAVDDAANNAEDAADDAAD
jgi:hypothetical protein